MIKSLFFSLFTGKNPCSSLQRSKSIDRSMWSIEQLGESKDSLFLSFIYYPILFINIRKKLCVNRWERGGIQFFFWNVASNSSGNLFLIDGYALSNCVFRFPYSIEIHGPPLYHPRVRRGNIFLLKWYIFPYGDRERGSHACFRLIRILTLI